MIKNKSKYSPPHPDEFYIDFKGDSNIFINDNDEDEYLEKYNLLIKRLSNGSTIFGTNRELNDIASTYVEFYFPSGAYNEPKDKNGINHLLEHIVFNKLSFKSRELEAYFNAETSAEFIKSYAEGPSNINVKNYGLWPILNENIKNIAELHALNSKSIQKEKNIVLKEYFEKQGNPSYRASKILNEITFNLDNPITYDSCGTPESMENINLNDLENIYNRIFIPTGLEVSIFSQGDLRAYKEILKIIEFGLESIPNSKQSPQMIKREMYDLINPKFKQGEFYMSDYGINNKQAYIYYVWLLPFRNYSIEAYAITRVREFFERKLHEFLRKSGIAYSSNVLASVGLNKEAIAITMSVPNTESIEKFSKKLILSIKDHVIENLTDSEIIKIEKIINKRLTAVPITNSERMNSAIYGLYNYGRIIDPDKTSELQKLVSKKEIKETLNLFSSITPSIIVIGDFSS